MKYDDVDWYEKLSQCQVGNFGRGIEAKREDQGTDTPVDIGVSVCFGYQAGKVTRWMVDRDKMLRQIRNSHLATVRVPAQGQIDLLCSIQIIDYIRAPGAHSLNEGFAVAAGARQRLKNPESPAGPWYAFVVPRQHLPEQSGSDSSRVLSDNCD